MARGPVNRVVIAVGVGVPVVALAVVVGVSVRGGDGDSPGSTTSSSTPATAPSVEPRVDEDWNDGIEDAVQPLDEALPALAEAVAAWSAGDLGDAGLTRVLDRVTPLVADVRARLDALGPHPEDDLAGPLMADMGSLYRHAIDAHRAALAAESDQLATQYDRLGRRLRVLGDRVFDRARERTAVPFDPGPDVDLRRPAEVPNWSRLDLAVGPPLEPGQPAADELPLQRRDERDSQPEQSWLTHVRGLDLPEVGELRSALAADSSDALGRHARRLVSAAESLRDVPVPDGDRGRADRIALGWLLRADGARAGQLGVIDGSTRSSALAESLVAMSGGPAYAVT